MSAKHRPGGHIAAGVILHLVILHRTAVVGVGIADLAQGVEVEDNIVIGEVARIAMRDVDRIPTLQIPGGEETITDEGAAEIEVHHMGARIILGEAANQ